VSYRVNYRARTARRNAVKARNEGNAYQAELLMDYVRRTEREARQHALWA
jgi:hypothetical protein